MFLHQLAKYKLCAIFSTWVCFLSILMHSLDLLNNRDVFRICALHKENVGVCTETAMPGVQGKEIWPLDRASPLPSHILNRVSVFGQYLILDLKGCVMCSGYLPWRMKCSAAPIRVWIYFFRISLWFVVLGVFFFPRSNRTVTSYVSFLTFFAVFSSLLLQLFLKVL